MKLNPVLPLLTGASHSGGEAVVFTEVGRPGYVIKRYKQDRRGPDADRILFQQAFLATLRPSDEERLRRAISWPLEAYGTEESIAGVLMQHVPAEYSFRATIGSGQRRAILQEASYLVDPEFRNRRAVRESNLEDPDLALRIEVCLDMLWTLDCLWNNGAVYGDISSKNVLWRLTPSPQVFLLEGDSIGHPDRFTHTAIGTPDFSPNSSLKDPWQRDRSVAALLIHRVLLRNPRANGIASVASETSGIPDAILAAIHELYQNGSTTSNEMLQLCLRSFRAEHLCERRLSEAFATGWAREIDHHLPVRPQEAPLALPRAVRRQIRLESRLEAQSIFAVPARDDAAQRRHNFRLDVPARIAAEIASIAGDPNRLMSLGAFEAAATSAHAAPALHGTSATLLRAVQHALAGAPQPAHSLVWDGTAWNVSWSWPPTIAVNAAIVTAEIADGKITRFSSKRSAETPTVRVTAPEERSSLSVRVTWAFMFRDGELITQVHDSCRLLSDKREAMLRASAVAQRVTGLGVPQRQSGNDAPFPARGPLSPVSVAPPIDGLTAPGSERSAPANDPGQPAKRLPRVDRELSPSVWALFSRTLFAGLREFFAMVRRLLGAA